MEKITTKMLQKYKSYEVTEENMAIIQDRFKNGNTGVVLVQGVSLISKLEQFFVKIQQWKKEGKVDTLPNHIDVVRDGYAIGALAKGVEGDSLWPHLKHHKGGKFWIVELNIKQSQKNALWMKMKVSEKKGYAYIDLLFIAFHILTGIWLGKKSNDIAQKRYTCFNLFAVMFNQCFYTPLFSFSRRATPFTVIYRMLQYPNVFLFESKN